MMVPAVDFQGHRNTIFDFGVTSRMLVTADANGRCHYYDATSGALLFDFGAHASSVLALAVLRDGAVVLTGSVDRTMRMTRVLQC